MTIKQEVMAETLLSLLLGFEHDVSIAIWHQERGKGGQHAGMPPPLSRCPRSVLDDLKRQARAWIDCFPVIIPETPEGAP